ncbi:hypothetical protein ACQI4L_11050 [Mycolicibacterium litorale]|uniref:hypothetical protein n=1 Tax=Mycolicibacterium litorale TaxID=758802 RepID=UPI003CEA9850
MQYSKAAASIDVLPLRSKLQALLMMLYSHAGDYIDPIALQAKLEALLKLPDPVLAQLLHHPDLEALNGALDAVFHGTSDMSAVVTELDKIDVVTTSGPTEQIDVVRVNGEPTYVVHSPIVQPAPGNVAGPTMSAMPQPPGEFRVVSLVDAPTAVSTFAAASSVQPPAPAAEPMARAMPVAMMAPDVEPVSPPLEATTWNAPTVTVAPSAEPTPTAVPEFAAPSSLPEPTSTPEASLDVATKENDYKPDETPTSMESDPTSEHRSPEPSAEETAGETGGPTNEEQAPSKDNEEGGGDPSGEPAD